MTPEATELRALAAGVLAPGFNGTEVPDWLRAEIAAGLGGVVLFAHNLTSLRQTAELTAALTADLRGARRGLLVASDEEGGDVTRIEAGAGSSLPGAAALGAVGDAELTGRVAMAHGRLLRALGITCGLAPVADVNSNSANPVIGVRSFGADPVMVAEQVGAYVTGLQQAGVLACAKHFPGHGDTGVDSHLAVPYLWGSLAELERRELVPFRAAVGAGTAAMMPGHLVAPQVDDLPASISPRWTEILRTDMSFAGMVITDALDMRAVADTHGVPRAAVLALRAGADLLCLGNTNGIDDEQMYADCLAAVTDALTTGELDPTALAASAQRRRRVLASIADHGITGTTGATEIADAAAELRRIGRVVAERAIDGSWPAGLPTIDAAPTVIDLRNGTNLAAGTIGRRLPAALRRTWPEIVELDLAVAGAAAVAAALADVRSPVLVLVRSPTTGTAERAALDEILSRRGDAVVLHTGWPTADVPPRTVFSYGSGAVNCEVLCEMLCDRLAGGG